MYTFQCCNINIYNSQCTAPMSSTRIRKKLCKKNIDYIADATYFIYKYSFFINLWSIVSYALLSFSQTSKGQLGSIKIFTTAKSANGPRIKESQTNVPRGTSTVNSHEASLLILLGNCLYSQIYTKPLLITAPRCRLYSLLLYLFILFPILGEETAFLPNSNQTFNNAFLI